jgi:hypothetical protein
VQATDDDGAVANGTITVKVTKPVPVNKAPIAVDDYTVTDAGVTVLIDVLANDSDPEGDFLTIEELSTDYGEVEVVILDNGNQGISYIPWESGITTTISYTIGDGNGNTADGMVTIDVLNPIIENQAPFINDQSLSVTTEVFDGDVIGTVEAFDEDGTVVSYMIIDGNVDADADGIEAFSIDSAIGELTVTDADELAYTYGAVALTVEVVDDGDATASATVTIDVATPVPPPPTYEVTAETDAVYEGDTVYFTISTTDVADGMFINYTLSGDYIDETDIADGSLGGSVEVYGGYASIAVALAVDDVYEGEEMLTLTVFDEFGFEPWASVTVYDF